MEIITSIQRLQQVQIQVRDLKKGFLTNFYLDESKHDIWVRRGCFFEETIGDTVFLVKQSKDFWNVFYCSTKMEFFAVDLQHFLEKYASHTLMFDIVGRVAQCQPMTQLLTEKGLEEATSLVRMTRLTAPMEYIEDPSVMVATAEEVPTISQLLHQFFDDKTEQIPFPEELTQYAQQGHILVCKENGSLAGFLIYEINTTTLYLRYWFTHPDFRDKKVGSRLLRRFFEEGKDTKRQLFWVIRSNENAIKRYRHYGFVEENMYDYVMQYN